MGSRVVITKSGRVKSGWFHGWRAVLAVFIGLVLLAVFGFAAAYMLIRVPDANEVATQETSIYYYSDGETELGRTSEVNRVSIPLDQVPDHMQQAMLAAEDRSFYENPGVSLAGLTRAAWAAVTGGPVQGGSTITQQYVKNYFLTHDQTLSRKGRELIISIKVEQQLSKDEILTNYFNTIYFGRRAYGIQAASQAYFNKDAKDLNLSESVFLAGIVQAPGNYDPANGAESTARAQERMDYVVDGMVSEGWLEESQAASVKMPKTVPPTPQVALGGPEGYVVAYARDELIYKAGISEEDVARGGLRVVTTIDKDDQEDAITAVENNRPGDERVRVGLASVKPGDGAILALYGGSDYAKNPYSSATQAQLQAGSTFKVFAVAAALEEGISTRSRFNGDSPRTFGRKYTHGAPWTVRNYGNADYGTVDIRTMLAKSVNTAFAELNFEVGPEKTMDMMVKLGIPQNSPDLMANGANVFGTTSIRVLDLANAYATIDAGGVRAEPYVVQQVTHVHDGFKPYEGAPSTTRVISEDVAADTIDAMRRVVTQGTATRAQGIGYPSAGKTGTTDEAKAVWYGGFTPQASTAVALYMPDEQGSPRPLRGVGGRSELTGSTYPLSIWTGYMRRFMDGKERIAFPDRVGIGDSRVRTYSEAPRRETATPTPKATRSREASPSEEPSQEASQSETSDSTAGDSGRGDTGGGDSSDEGGSGNGAGANGGSGDGEASDNGGGGGNPNEPEGFSVPTPAAT